VERSKSKVLAETYRQLAQRGISGVSLDEVSRVSGISKTTIYRHWPSRTALLIDACSRLGSIPPAPDTGSLREDLRQLLTGLASQLQTANWSTVYPSIIDAAERDTEIAFLQTELHKAHVAPFKTVMERAVKKGWVVPLRTQDHVVAALVGPLFYRRWFSKQKIDKSFITALVDNAVGS
jgi:AcrR family transcriptional regulator